MDTTSSNIGNKVKLATFNSWGCSGIIEAKELTENGITYVNNVLCRVCKNNKIAISQHPAVKGKSKVSAQAFIDGTNVVTKFCVC